MRARARDALTTLAALLCCLAAAADADAADAEGVPAAAGSKPPAIEQRDASAEERHSFDAYFQQRVAQATAAAHGARPMPPLFAPTFDIERRRGSRAWTVIARVDAAPRHAGPGVCGQVRTSFIYNPQTRAWGETAEPPQLYVWLDQPARPCGAPVQTVLLAQPLPWEDVVSLLRQQSTLLSRARLLFAGNTECARLRALNFKLAALEKAAPAAGSPVMFGLLFQSDRDSVARVAVRKNRGEFTAWNASCR